MSSIGIQCRQCLEFIEPNAASVPYIDSDCAVCGSTGGFYIIDGAVMVEINAARDLVNDLVKSIDAIRSAFRCVDFDLLDIEDAKRRIAKLKADAYVVVGILKSLETPKAATSKSLNLTGV